MAWDFSYICTGITIDRHVAISMEAVEANRIRAGGLELSLPVADIVIIQWVGQKIRDHAVVGPGLSESI